ncbi:hypothetical protein [Nitrosomonas aestuarii]|uniref:hypothetical protein n=1 Tax=Nitrosomonas aestuarii TaxID=52441 RepID=UPI000D31C0E3|nr:hypothetical protein [Nitrosomonas aestuarii]PTN12977.1 hypothetical protein C8R11_102258 [Nitrosomonas aestuarii]
MCGGRRLRSLCISIYHSVVHYAFLSIRIMADPQLSIDRSIKQFQEISVYYLTIGVPDFNLRTLLTTSHKQNETANRKLNNGRYKNSPTSEGWHDRN